MKILNLIQCLNLGGMEKAAYTLASETQAKGISWQIQSVTPSGLGKSLFTNLDIPVKDNQYEGKLGYKSHLALRNKVKHFDGDLILVTGPTLTGCLSIKGNIAKKILGIHFCHKYNQRNILTWKLFYQYFSNDYDLIICHSQYLLEQVKEIAPYLEYKLRLIDNSTQLNPLTTDAEKLLSRQSLNIPPDSFVIGNAGWLIERKRFDIFLKICANIHQLNQQVFFVIAGDGPLRFELEELATNLGIINKVKFLGWQKDLEPFYKAIDLLLFNSNSDAFGRTVMEAMGYGIPVVASVLEGGTNSILVHQENGYLFAEHDIELLSRYCLKLIDDKKIYHKFQSSALQIIRQKFSNEIYINKYLEVFKEVLNN